jgi:hypothetical protein
MHECMGRQLFPYTIPHFSVVFQLFMDDNV